MISYMISYSGARFQMNFFFSRMTGTTHSSYRDMIQVSIIQIMMMMLLAAGGRAVTVHGGQAAAQDRPPTA
jgi:hypothetical protein